MMSGFFNSKTLLYLSCVAVLAACQVGQKRLTLAEQIRGIDSEQEAGLQIYGLRNRIVTDLMSQALGAESRQDYTKALMLLDQALLIEPNAPDLLQQRAEVKIEQGRWMDAGEDVLRSIDLGPKLGQLCKRNWRALAMVYTNMGQRLDADKARARVPLCERTRPDRF